jgi:hypothetical protein
MAIPDSSDWSFLVLYLKPVRNLSAKNDAYVPTSSPHPHSGEDGDFIADVSRKTVLKLKICASPISSENVARLPILTIASHFQHSS